MKQVIFSRCIVASSSGFINPCHGNAHQTTEANGRIVCAAAGTLSNLRVVLSGSPGGTGTRTFAVRKNGVDTAVTVTFGAADTIKQDITHSVAIAAGDTLSVHHTQASFPNSAVAYLAADFDSTSAGESIYGYTGSTAVSGAHNGVLSGRSWDTGATGTQLTIGRASVIPTAGALTALYYQLASAPGIAASGKSVTFVAYKNGVKQDGAGGTVNTQVTILETATTGNWTGTLPLVAGDLIYLECSTANTPTTSNTAHGARFTATVDGQSIISGQNAGVGSNSVNNFIDPDIGEGTYTATETNTDRIGGVTTMFWSNLYVVMASGPGGASSWTWATRKNNATPGTAPTVVISGASTSGQDLTHSLSIASGDTWTLLESPASTPGGSSGNAWAWVLTLTSPANTGSGDVTAGPDQIAGSGSSTPPVFSGSGDVTAGPDQIAGSGTYTPAPISGSGDVTIGPDQIAGFGPADARITQAVAEVFGTIDPSARATQSVAEVFGSINSVARVTQTVIEVFGLPSPITAIACVSPTALVGAPYGYAFAVTGGSSPYTFAITVGSLPPGLTLNTATGLVSGAPTTAGSYSYTVQVTDLSGSTKTASCTIVVAAPAGPPVVYEPPCAITNPLVWATVQAEGLFDTTVKVNAALRVPLRDTPAVYGGYKPPRLTSVGPVARVSSDWLTRAWSAQTATAKFADTDRAVANIAGLTSLRTSQLYVYLTSRANRKLGAMPRLLFQGPIFSEDQQDLSRTVTANDIIGIQYDLFSGSVKIPKRLIGTGDFPRAAISVVNQGVPIIGGYVQDTINTVGGGADTGTRYRVGAVPGIDIGDLTVGGLSGRGVLFAGHALKQYDNLYLNKSGDTAIISIVDGLPTIGGLPVSDFGSKLIAPGRAGAPIYYDINGNRYSLVLVRDATYVNQLDNGYTLRANVQGAETVGDGTGTLMEDGPLLCEWLLLNWLIGDYHTGGWLVSPQFEFYPGSGIFLDRVNHESFVRASLVGSSLLAGGFKGAFVIGAAAGGGAPWGTAAMSPTVGLKGSDEILKDALFSWNLMLRWNQFNQFEVVMLDRRRSAFLGTKRSVTWQQDILSQPRFKPTLKQEWFANEQVVFHEPIYGIVSSQPTSLFSPWSSGYQQENDPSLVAYGAVRHDIALPMVFDHATANIVGRQVMDFAGTPRYVATFARSLCGLADDVLDGIPVTHYVGRGTKGWLNQGSWILAQRINPVTATVEVDAVNVDDLLS